jgi:hypothetical protein
LNIRALLIPNNEIVNRVHWLRARALSKRWKEEFVLVGYKMQWMINFYVHQSEIWKERRTAAETMEFPGAGAYADRQNAMWLEVKSTVELQFKGVNPDFREVVN